MQIQRVLTLFGYSLLAIALILLLGGNLSCRTRLILSLVALILLNAPTLLAMLFHTRTPPMTGQNSSICEYGSISTITLLSGHLRGTPIPICVTTTPGKVCNPCARLLYRVHLLMALGSGDHYPSVRRHWGVENLFFKPEHAPYYITA